MLLTVRCVSRIAALLSEKKQANGTIGEVGGGREEKTCEDDKRVHLRMTYTAAHSAALQSHGKEKHCESWKPQRLERFQGREKQQ